MSTSTISLAILIALAVSSQAHTASDLANTFSYVAQCETATYNLSSGNSSIQCAGCLEYEVSETMAHSCSTDNNTLFNYTYKCRSCEPGYTINEANSSLSHIYSDVSLGGANVSFAGDCVGTENTTYELNSTNAQYNNYSQVIACVNSVITYSFNHSCLIDTSNETTNDTSNDTTNGTSNDTSNSSNATGLDMSSCLTTTYVTQIACGNCSQLALTRDLSASTCSASGIQQVAYTYTCVACDNGCVPSTLATYGVRMYGNVNIDLTSSCVPPVSGHGGEYRANSANIAYYSIMIIVAAVSVLLN